MGKNHIEKEIFITVTGVSSDAKENTILGGFANPLPPSLDNPYGALVVK